MFAIGEMNNILLIKIKYLYLSVFAFCKPSLNLHCNYLYNWYDVHKTLQLINSISMAFVLQTNKEFV